MLWLQQKKRRRQEIFYGHDRNPKEECRKYFVTAFHKLFDISDMDKFFDLSDMDNNLFWYCPLDFAGHC